MLKAVSLLLCHLTQSPDFHVRNYTQWETHGRRSQMCHFSHPAQHQVLLGWQRLSFGYSNQFPLTTISFCTEWETLERSGVSGLPFLVLP